MVGMRPSLLLIATLAAIPVATGVERGGREAFFESFKRPQKFCGTNQACLDHPLIASSKEELEWLHAHGYPSLRELRRLRALSKERLQAEASSGSTNAMIVLGTRLANEKREAEGLEQLLRAANAGSLYAHYLIADAYARSTNPPDQVEGLAHLRVAALMGDWKAAAQYDRRSEALASAERLLVEERASALLTIYAKDGVTDPRPLKPPPTPSAHR